MDWQTGHGSEQIEVFQYLTADDASAVIIGDNSYGSSAEDLSADNRNLAEQRDLETAIRAEYENRIAEETRRSFEAGRERGRQEGRSEESNARKDARAIADAQRIQQLALLVERFGQERDRYLQTVEHEVVKLALAIAARILRREAQMDPLLLTGAVRVALGQLAASTKVHLRVPPAELNLWEETLALLPNLSVKPVLTAGDGMQCGDCAIETSLGSVDLGIRAQLAEIERGFFDRAGDRLDALTGAHVEDKASSADRESEK